MCPVRFRVQSVRFHLLKKSLLEKAFAAVLQPLINTGVGWLDWYERRLCRLLPVSEIRYVLQPVKDGEPARARAA